MDTVVGTSGNDTITAGLAVDPATGLATVATLTTFDSIDGGAGTDTLNAFFSGAVTALPGVTVKNVENVNFNAGAGFVGDISSWTGVQNVTLTQTGTAAAQNLTVKGATTVAVKGGSTVAVTDTSTTPADRGATVTTVSLDGNTGAATLHGDGIKTLNISNTNQAATVNAKAGTRELAVAVDKVTGGTITDGEATTVVLNTKGAVSGGFTVSAAKATAVTINAEAAIGRADPALAGVTLTVGEAKSLTVNGSAAVKVETSTLTKVETINAAANKGGVEIVGTLGDAVVFTGGEGKDKVTVGTTTKTINMGGGDDTVVVTGALGTGGKLDGGAGSNTIQATATVAQTLTATDTFSKAISNFQKLSIGQALKAVSAADSGAAATAATSTINLANLAGISYVTSAGTQALAGGDAASAEAGRLVVNNLANGGTFELTGAINGVSQINIKDAATNAADVLNIKLNGASNIVNAAATTVASVETINIQATNSGKFGPTAASKILLDAANATKIVVTGNHGVDFASSTLTSVTELNASGVVATGAQGATAAQIATAGAVTFTSAVTDKAVTVTTGNGNDVIDLSSVTDGTKGSATVSTGEGNDQVTGTAGNDTIDLGAGNDVVNSTAGADTITLGAGNDSYVLTDASHSVLAKGDIITDFSANTKANATASKGAVSATAADWTGDTINVSALITAAGAATTGISVFVASSAADAQTFIQNTANAGTLTGFALDSSTGKLYMDFGSDGTIDSVITLTGATSITEAAFVTGIA